MSKRGKGTDLCPKDVTRERRAMERYSGLSWEVKVFDGASFIIQREKRAG